MMHAMILKLFFLILLFKTANSFYHYLKGPNGLVEIERAHKDWVKLVGSFNHSRFFKANKFKPCRAIKVNKNPKLGDFVSVQEAINSLPVVNLCQVVISVSAGIYRTVFYGQYKCWGPGAEYGGRVSWSRELTPQEAKPFISLEFIDGYYWLPYF